MSSKTPPTLGKRYNPNSLPEAGENCINATPPIELLIKGFPETHNPPARKRSRKTNPAVTENPSYRPPANLSVCSISNTENNKLVNSLYNPGIPNIPKTSSRKRKCARQPKIDSVQTETSINTNISFIVKYLTPAGCYYAKLPNALLQIQNNFVGHIVFPLKVFSTFKPTPVVRDFSSLEIPSYLNRPNTQIQSNVYGAGDTNRAYRTEGSDYSVKHKTVIVIHPTLKLQDTRNFIAAIPIPRTGKDDTDCQYLKRIVIARDSGVKSHVNIKVEESSLLGTFEEVLNRYNSYEYIRNESNPTQSPESSLSHSQQTQNKLASPSSISSSPLCDRTSLGVHSTHYLVLCENCGVSSQDFKRCDSCKKLISKNAKYILNSYAPNSISQVTRKEEVTVSSTIRSAVKNPGVTKVGRKRKAADCITLSSDEECDAQLSKHPQVPSFNSPATPISAGHAETPVRASVVMQNTLNVSPFLTSTPVISNQLPVVPCLPSIPVGISNSRTRTISKEEFTPEQLIAELEGAEHITELKGSIIALECRSIRVGSYKIAPSEPNSITRKVTLSPKGILFSLPHCVTNHAVKLVIPLDTIMNVKVCYKKLSVIFITTGPKLASWMRKQLGMGLDPNDEHYFCPLNGTPFQKNIIFLLDNVIKELGRGILMRIFGKTMTELDYDSAHKMLVQANTYPKTQAVATPVSLRNHHIPPSPLPSALAHSPSSTSQNKPLKTETAPSPIQKTIAYTNHKAIVQNPVQSSVPAQSATPASQPQPTISNQSKGSSNETETPNPELSDVPTENRKLIKSSWGMELLDHDLESLAEEMFLNDQIIDFWLKYIERYKFTDADRKRTYIFSSFFYSKLTSKQKSENTKIHVTERRHSRVAKWTKNEDIFQYDYLLVPIVENAHWILAVICFPAMDGIYDYDTGEYISDLKTKRTKAKPKSQENSSQEGLSSTDSAQKQKRIPKKVNLETRNLKQPCILIFDSLAQEPRNKIYSTLREYLHVEYRVKKGVEKEFSNQTMPGCMPRVPQQPNYCDCGLYLLQFAESFFSHPIKSYKSNFNNELSKWFKDSETRTKRKQIYDAIVELITKDNPANVQHIPKLTFPTAMIQKPKKEKKTENVVKIQQDVNQDKILDVGVESESSTTSKHRIASSSSHLHHDHDYTKLETVQTSKEESLNVTAEKAHSSPAAATSNQTLSTASPSYRTVSTHASPVTSSAGSVKKSVPDPPTSKQTVVAASKINLTVPTVSLSVNKQVSTAATTVISQQSDSLPVKKLPCYANANATTPNRKQWKKNI